MAATEILATSRPSDVLLERANDPDVAASLLVLLDHADLIATLVGGLADLVARSDTILDSVASSVGELATVARESAEVEFPSAQEFKALAARLTTATPVIIKALDSRIVAESTVDFLALASESVAEAKAAALTGHTSVRGFRSVLAIFKDPDVGRGMGLMVEIARALGRRLNSQR